MSYHVSLEEWIEQFEWDSEDQKKGFLSLLKFLGSRRQLCQSDRPPEERIEDSLMASICWLIQKDHESNEWYNERIAELDKKHLDTQAHLLKRISALEQRLGAPPTEETTDEHDLGAGPEH